MDPRLVAWARAVKARRLRAGTNRHGTGRTGGRSLPVLWLFTDSVRLPDPRPAARRLPRGLCGVVLRHDGVPGRAALGRDLALLCRARGNRLAVAGDARLAAALGAGVHLRGGCWPGLAGRHRARFPVTSSAHGAAELRRARRAGAAAAFLSPAFPTLSHPGAPALGPARWTRLARLAGLPVLALGGVDATRARRLAPGGRGGACAGLGGIAGFS